MNESLRYVISGEKSLKKIREFFRVSIQRSCHSLMYSGANRLSFKFCRLSASVVRNFPWSLHFFTFVFPEEPFVFKIFNFFCHSGYVITIFKREESNFQNPDPFGCQVFFSISMHTEESSQCESKFKLIYTTG